MLIVKVPFVHVPALSESEKQNSNTHYASVLITKIKAACGKKVRGAVSTLEEADRPEASGLNFWFFWLSKKNKKKKVYCFLYLQCPLLFGLTQKVTKRSRLYLLFSSFVGIFQSRKLLHKG